MHQQPLSFFPPGRHGTKLGADINQSAGIRRGDAQPSESCKRLVEERSLLSAGLYQSLWRHICWWESGKVSQLVSGSDISCHAGLLDASDTKRSCNFQKPEVTTICMSAPFCCCHSSKTKLILNALSLGITQIPKPHLSHDQWWVCSSIVRSKPLQNTKTYILHIFSTLLYVNSKIFFCPFFFFSFLFFVFKISTVRSWVVFYLREVYILHKCVLTPVLSLTRPRSSGCNVLPELVMMSLTPKNGHFSVLV